MKGVFELSIETYFQKERFLSTELNTLPDLQIQEGFECTTFRLRVKLP